MKKQINQLFISALLLSAFFFNYGCNKGENPIVDNSPIPNPGLPGIKDLIVKNIVFSTAEASAIITADGGSPILSYGICWSKSPLPTFELGTKTRIDSSPGKFGEEFKHNLTLEPQTRYYARAFALNKAGITYSNEQVFVTKPSLAVDRDITINTINPTLSIYPTIMIGEQVWTSVNLNVGTYRDDSVGKTQNISFIKTPISNWTQASSGAFSIYSENEINRNLFGRLYNYYTITNKLGLCPAGWHVPSEQEWDLLIMNTGGVENSGLNLKGRTLSQITNLPANPDKQWLNPVLTIDNFRATPGGFRSGTDGKYKNLGLEGTFWTSTPAPNDTGAISISIKNNDPTITKVISNKRNGHSIRCIWDGNPK